MSYAIFLTLALRPVGAALFGWLADRYGRRTPLMASIVAYSVISLLCGFAPSLAVLLFLRALFGIAMGGEWGLGASLAMESVPPETRGLLSGILQSGYNAGYLLAAVVYRLVFPLYGWRAMFFVGLIPALLSLFIRAKVHESPVYEQQKAQAVRRSLSDTGAILRKHGGVFLYLVALMTAFTFMSHGTQDMYPTFLRKQHHFNPSTVSAIAVTLNIGALFGGVCFGAFSQKIGRKRAILLASGLALPLVPLWAFAQTPVMLAVGAFLIQFMVQGAWGVIPAHLSELAPNALRGTFIGFTYQLGNLFSSGNAPLQSHFAEKWHGDLRRARWPAVIVIVLICVFVITALGREAKDVSFENPKRKKAWTSTRSEKRLCRVVSTPGNAKRKCFQPMQRNSACILLFALYFAGRLTQGAAAQSPATAPDIPAIIRSIAGHAD